VLADNSGGVSRNLTTYYQSAATSSHIHTSFGVIGNTGPTGETGPTGLNGDVGPVGSVVAFAGSVAPSGWLFCDGGAYDGTDPLYQALYNIIQNTFGGTTASSFNVPDLRQKFPVGAQSVTSNGYNYALGATGGEQVHTLTVTEMPAHSHTITPPVIEYNLSGFGNGGSSNWIGGPVSTTDSTGGDVAHNNVPPFLSLNYIIKY
jgi:microcystin-dependent protein